MQISVKRIAIFIGTTLLFTWLAEYALWRNGGLAHPRTQIILMGLMLIPALCSILTRLLTNEGRDRLLINLNVRENAVSYLLAWFVPGILILAGAALYFLIFPHKFDPEMTVLQSSILALDPSAVEIEKSKLVLTVLLQYISALVLAPILNFVPSLGEELGWRGYLFPKLTEVTSRRKAVLISGVIWGIWHAPIIAMGYNYGVSHSGYPWAGILAMIVFCIFSGSFLCWLTLRSQSVIPATAAHGAINGMAAAGAIFLSGQVQPFVGPFPTGVIGGLGLILLGVFCWLKIEKLQIPEKIENGS